MAGKINYAAVNYNRTVKILKQYGDHLTAAVILWKESNSPQGAINLLSDQRLYEPALKIANDEGLGAFVDSLKKKINEESKNSKSKGTKKPKYL